MPVHAADENAGRAADVRGWPCRRERPDDVAAKCCPVAAPLVRGVFLRRAAHPDERAAGLLRRVAARLRRDQAVLAGRLRAKALSRHSRALPNPAIADAVAAAVARLLLAMVQVVADWQDRDPRHHYLAGAVMRAAQPGV